MYFRCNQKLRAIHELLCWKLHNQELTGQWLELKHILKRSNIERILSPDRSVCVHIIHLLTVKCAEMYLLAWPCQCAHNGQFKNPHAAFNEIWDWEVLPKFGCHPHSQQHALLVVRVIHNEQCVQHCQHVGHRDILCNVVSVCTKRIYCILVSMQTSDFIKWCTFDILMVMLILCISMPEVAMLV